MLNLLHYLIIALLFNSVVFLFAYKLMTDKLTDISYALTFILLVSLSFLYSDRGLFKIVLLLMVLLWALRLGVFLFLRVSKSGRDKRFDGMREDFYKFLKFWVLQGVAVWVILLPSIMFFRRETIYSYFVLIGFLIWFFGFFIELIADFQKYKFNKSNQGKWISTGLWRYSRHPNYFGEILCWFGIYFFAFGSLMGVERIVGLISPLFIAVLLIFLTGLPQLEKYADKKWGKVKEYREYKRKTSILVPWFVGK
jgi:steroid 5-alpha reductase family enzyme